jgi:DNA-3-methyladenine glycosylase I
MSETTPLGGYCGAALGHPHHGPYHDQEYGFPIRADDLLFGRLILEINQAGLSWLTILRKKEGFGRAYSQFRVEDVAGYGEDDRQRLLADAGIVRNRLKVDAAIQNARTILDLRKEFGSFAGWLDRHHPRPKEEWVRLFKNTFRFTGGEITGEFLISTGYLPGAHVPECPVFHEIAAHHPPWMATDEWALE